MSSREERPEGAAGEVLRRRRRAAVRDEVHRGDGCRWELGWDPAMETCFAAIPRRRSCPTR